MQIFTFVSQILQLEINLPYIELEYSPGHLRRAFAWRTQNIFQNFVSHHATEIRAENRRKMGRSSLTIFRQNRNKKAS